MAKQLSDLSKDIDSLTDTPTAVIRNQEHLASSPLINKQSPSQVFFFAGHIADKISECLGEVSV